MNTKEKLTEKINIYKLGIAFITLNLYYSIRTEGTKGYAAQRKMIIRKELLQNIINQLEQI